MRQYLVECGADGWRDWTIVPNETPDGAEWIARGRFPKATWAVVIDDVTDALAQVRDGVVTDDV